jgi:hypothetical protein
MPDQPNQLQVGPVQVEALRDPFGAKYIRIHAQEFDPELSLDEAKSLHGWLGQQVVRQEQTADDQETLIVLIAALLDPRPCEYGAAGCTVHDHIGMDPCPHDTARELLADLGGQTRPETAECIACECRCASRDSEPCGCDCDQCLCAERLAEVDRG